MADEKPKKPPSPRKKSEAPAKGNVPPQAPKKQRDESNPNWWKNEGGGKGEVH